jgi:hypothetical protein
VSSTEESDDGATAKVASKPKARVKKA